MLICANCKAENTEGTLICLQCGKFMEPMPLTTFGTRQLKVTDLLSQEREFTVQEQVYQADKKPIREKALVLFIKGFDNALMIPLDQQIMMGRHGGEVTGMKFISLEVYGAVECGVSRRHALFYWKEEQLRVRDLGSSNGTYLNGAKLDNKIDSPVRDGDEVSLGKLSFKLFFK